MLVYRICQDKYAESLDGEGAFRKGGRWNSKGVRVLYTSGSIALASLEVLVHTDGVPLRSGISLVTISIPADSILPEIDLPNDWNQKPVIQETRDIGDRFVSQNKWLTLQVPSAVISAEHNFIINPLHSRFSEVEIENITPFVFDNRL